MKTPCLALTCSLVLASTAAFADEPAPAFTPRAGFTVEGRLRIASDGALGSSAQNAPFFLGWRGERIALLVGPMFAHDNLNRAKTTNAGVDLRGELTIGRYDDRRIEAYVPIEGTVGAFFEDDVHSVAWSLGAGIGGRYWIASGFGIFAEGGVAVADTPSLAYAATDENFFAQSSGRIVHANVTASLGLAYTF